MNTLRGLFSAALLVASMVGFAGPAQANPRQQVLEGVYNYHQEGVAEVGTWTIYPVCVPVVGDLRAEIRDPVACTLHVSGTPTTWVTGGDAKLTGGQWAYSVNKKDGFTCPDGSTVPTLTTIKFNTETMTGTRSVAHNQVCGLPATLETVPFTLSFREPLPIPVQKYPLYCEPGGLRRCF
ncbi:hypothetical protein [Mycolicibacterium sp. P9-22]|uniref:hypothetical protein n=1 Tax=Mycolicibacterium sp. P9-22 TaxID=2024613 RepID=UPI0011EBD0D4|nr:hypothetical protein [Mycolicibacterium sp. P9-22]KAA0120482.1 hypothetical protein CIW51_03100 [Mycolicibacterium sp. P9-22]